MSQFEYLRKISIGQYLPLGSCIHRLDPRVKLLAYAGLVIAVSLTHQLAGLLFSLIVAGMLMYASRTPWGYLTRAWFSALPFLLILAGLQLFILRPQESQVPILLIFRTPIYMVGVWAALRLLMRFSVLMALLTVSSATLSTLEIIDSMHMLLKPLRWMGINPSLPAMAVQIMLRFIPFLALSAEKIAKSQASRGAQWDGKQGGLLARARRVLPLIIPLFTNSLRQAETLADAMLARGFGARHQRTSLREYTLHGADIAFFCSALACALLIILPAPGLF